MSDLYNQWSAAKADFAKSKALFPPELLSKLEKGAGLGPALKSLDKAESYEKRAKAVASVRGPKEQYDANIRAVIKEVDKKDSAAQKSLERLARNVQAIWLEADKLGQPPRPSGSTVPHEVIRNFNLGAGFKPQFLDLKVTRIDVIIELDKTLEALIKAGEESLKIGHLGDVAKAEVEKISGDFVETIKAIDAKIETLDPSKRDAKIKEANEVLKHYAKIVEDRTDAAVQAEWKSYLARKKYLSDFRLKCGVKVALGVVALGVSVTSAALSFGVLWMNVLASAKAVTDIAQTIKTWAQDLDTVYGELLNDIDAVAKLNLQREAAKEKGEGQKASKAKEAAKEILTGLLPITKNMVKSASDIENRSKQFLGLISKLETQSDKLVGQLNAVTKLMTKLPEAQMTPALRKEADKMQDTFEKLFTEITDLHRRSQNAARFGDRALKAAQKLRKEDSWTGVAAETGVGVGGKAAALFALANFGFECAKHGASLLAAI